MKGGEGGNWEGSNQVHPNRMGYGLQWDLWVCIKAASLIVYTSSGWGSRSWDSICRHSRRGIWRGG